MGNKYSKEKNVQILISLLKAHGIKKVIASPGMTNVSFVASIQNDPFFTVYSCVDERSAAYMACGMAAETGEPIVISCTGATASRNYYPALTEAFYRQLPILAVTSSQNSMRIGQNIPQITDRRHVPPDVVKMSVELPTVTSLEENWYCNLKANEAILELTHKGKGPVHINLITDYSQDFSCKKLPDERIIHRIEATNKDFPALERQHIAIFVGAHEIWNESLTSAVDTFCEKYNAVVLCDVTSNYAGKYGVFANIITNQHNKKPECCNVDLLIHIGAISGSYMNLHPKEVWRVNPDGRLIDTFKKLTYVFEVSEEYFFETYVNRVESIKENITDFNKWEQTYLELNKAVPELPFSCLWIARQTQMQLTGKTRVHFGILNALRCWNYTGIPNEVYGFCNVGGFGIDGCVSSMIGSAISRPEIMHIAFVGDLAFFYDLNSLGNRHIENNICIVVINNGRGFEFEKYDCFPVASGLDKQYEIDPYIAAAGHFSGSNNKTVKFIAEAFGFRYLTASTKEEYLKILPQLTTVHREEGPLLIEIFTNANDENDAQYIIEHLTEDNAGGIKKTVKTLMGEKTVQKLKGALKPADH